LLKNKKVSLKKFEPNAFERGLKEGEEPFPVQPKIGPYIVSKFVISLIN
tara:strand:- start:484 stop:630 length:147 start_codon:yes stop_codon:yes gene_type:complete